MPTDQTLVIPCSRCATLNRVPQARLQDVPICSECREHLLGQPPVELTTATFEAFAAKSDLPVVVDFWAPWCGPCRSMAPHYAQAAQALAGHALCAKVNSDDSPELAERFQISGIPTLVVLDHGTEVRRTTGAMSARQIEDWVRSRG